MDNTETLDTRAQASLYAKVARAMGTVKRIPQAGENKHFNYRFATAADVADAIRDALAAEGVAFFPAIVSLEQTPRGDKQTRTRVQFQFTFADGETGAIWSSLWWAEADDSTDKGINKAATAAKKYFLMNTFIMSAGDEADADADGKAEPLPRQSAKRQAEQPTIESITSIMVKQGKKKVYFETEGGLMSDNFTLLKPIDEYAESWMLDIGKTIALPKPALVTYRRENGNKIITDVQVDKAVEQDTERRIK